MKKKLALLLALSMVLSMLPMNVFGASRIFPDTSVTSLQVGGGRLSLEVSLDFADFYQHVQTNQFMLPGERHPDNYNAHQGYPVSFVLRNGAIFGTGSVTPVTSTINGFAALTTREAIEDVVAGILGEEDGGRSFRQLPIAQQRALVRMELAMALSTSEANITQDSIDTVIDRVTTVSGSAATNNAIAELIEDAVMRGWSGSNGAAVMSDELLASRPDLVGRIPANVPITFITAGNDKTSSSTQASLTGDRYVVWLNGVEVRRIWDSFFNANRPVEATLYFGSYNMDFDGSGSRRTEFEMPTSGFMRAFSLPVFAHSTGAEIQMIDRYRGRQQLGNDILVDWQPITAERNLVTAAVRAPVSFESYGVLDQVSIAEPYENFIDGTSGGRAGQLRDGTSGRIPVSLASGVSNSDIVTADTWRENADFIQFRLSTNSGITYSDTMRTTSDEPDWAVLGATGIWTGNSSNEGSIGTPGSFYPAQTYTITSRFGTFNPDRISINNQQNRESPTRNRVVLYFRGNNVRRNLTGGTGVRGDVLTVANLLTVSFDARQQYGQDLYLQYNYNNEVDTRNRIVWRNAGVAARRGEEPTGITIVGERRSSTVTDLRKIRTGGALTPLVNNNDGRGLVNPLSDSAPTDERNNRRTNVILIRESNVNTWNSHSTTIDMPDGVEIRGAHVAVYDRRPDNTRVRVNGTFKDWVNTSNNQTSNTRLDEFTKDDSNDRESWVAISTHSDTYNNAGITITPKQLTLNPSFNLVSANAKEVEIQFILSIEAGYAWKNSNGDTQTPVTVTLNDPVLGTQALDIATAVDPISVDIVNDPVEVPVDAAFNVSRHNIGDIVITESEVGMLQQRQELWLYVIGNRNTDISLDANRVPEVSGNTQFKIYNGRQLNHQFANIWLNGIRFNIERGSQVNRTGEEPAEIVIRDVEISGTLYSGVEYQVVISGNAVAGNDYTVMMDEPIDTTNRGYRDIVGMFDTIPYYVTPFTLDESTYGPPPTTDTPSGGGSGSGVPGTVAPGVTGRTPLFLNVNSPRIPVTVNGQTNEYVPFAMIPVTRNVSAGGISAAVFAQFIGGTADWASPVATITGTNAQGQSTTVTLTSGSNVATINGQSIDIAAGSNYSSEFANQVSPYLSPAGSMYLPLAFLCNAFGVQYEWNPSTATVTLR